MDRASRWTLLILLAAASPVVDSDCSISEILDQNPCGGQLSCDGDFYDAKTTILQMPCLHIYDYDTDTTDADIKHQNISIEVTATGFDFFDANDTSIVDELNDHITAISITKGRMKKVPNAISNLRETTIVDLSYNQIVSLNLSAFSAASKLEMLNVAYNNIGYLDVQTDSKTYSSVPIITLDLSHNNIRGNLKGCIPQYQTLQHLNLSFNYLETVHNTAFDKLMSLRTLDISNNRITNLGSSLNGLISLERLSLDHNYLTSITKDNFYGIRQLTNLNISSNSIKNIENTSFTSLLSLNQLDISNNQMNTLPKSLFQNNSLLSSLDVSYNKIMRIESGAFAGAHIENLKLHNNTLAGCLDTDAFNGLYFEKLDLSDGDIAELGPALFGPNPTFHSLNFSNNIISKISKTTFRKLNLLIDLDLSYNRLQTIEFDATDLKNLTHLHLNNNAIKHISKEAFEFLISARVIDLSHNSIKYIESMSFQNLKALNTLYLNHNPITSIDSRTFIGLTTCYTLDLSETKITKLTNNAFSGMESLNRLNVSHSDLSELEFNAFNGTKSIEFLDLSHNQIETFTINNTNFKLQELLLASNNIKTIRKISFQNLSDVSLIDFSNNKIFRIPPGSFRDCKMLQNLNFSSNRLSFLQYGVFEGLERLENIDLSNNRFEKFDAKVLYDYYVRDNTEIRSLYLDNNFIQKINFSEFSDARVLKLSIGGNLLTCDSLARFRHDYFGASFYLTAKKLNFDVENVDGISCVSQAEYVNSTETHVNGIDQNIYLDRIISLNIYSNRYLAAIFSVLLCATVLSLGVLVYYKLRFSFSSSHMLSSSRQELPNAIELE